MTTVEMAPLDALRMLLATRVGVDPARVVPEATLQGDLGLDSLDVAEVSIEMEKRSASPFRKRR